MAYWNIPSILSDPEKDESYFLRSASSSDQNFSYNEPSTIDLERFAELNIYGFSPTKFFVEIVSQCIGHQCSILYLKLKIRGKTFAVSSKITKTMHESLAQQIFPRFRYIFFVHDMKHIFSLIIIIETWHYYSKLVAIFLHIYQ